MIPGSFQMHVPLPYPSDYQVIGKPFSHIPGIKTGIDLHRVPMGDQAGNGRWNGVETGRPDGPDGGIQKDRLKKEQEEKQVFHGAKLRCGKRNKEIAGRLVIFAHSWQNQKKKEAHPEAAPRPPR